MQTNILYLLTRTPLHVGAGASVGAIDQPIQRERHTGFPIIPATSLKGSFADEWNNSMLDGMPDKNGKISKVRVTNSGEHSESAWLFGSDNDKPAYAGSLIFSEARVIAFPIRSAKGSFAWITCPLMLQRASRDGVIRGSGFHPPCQNNPPQGSLPEPADEQAIFKTNGPLALGDKIVIEEYCFTRSNDEYPADLAQAIANLVPDDNLFQSITDRLVILSNGMMSHFVTTCCEVAQHVCISDETGTAEDGGLFNQENVPADTLFYSVLSATNSRVPDGGLNGKTAECAINAFTKKVKDISVFQFGGDASTGLGFTSVIVAAVCNRPA